jgi:hypothetical protein
VVHGPEIIDRGCALLLINYLKKRCHLTAVLGGTMGRVAVIDAGLDDVITIKPRSRSSQSVQDQEAASYLIFLLNQAKSRESGLAFGAMWRRLPGLLSRSCKSTAAGDLWPYSPEKKARAAAKGQFS